MGTIVVFKLYVAIMFGTKFLAKPRSSISNIIRIAALVATSTKHQPPHKPNSFS